MKKFHHYLLKGLLLVLILPFLSLQKGFAAGETDSSVQLADALKLVRDHYKVDILFEDKTVEGLTVPAGLVDFGRTAEENINALVKPFGLNYKKVKGRSYLIVANKDRRQSKGNPAGV